MYLGMLFSPGAQLNTTFSRLSNWTTAGKGSPVVSCLLFISAWSSTNSVATCSLSICSLTDSSFAITVLLISSVHKPLGFPLSCIALLCGFSAWTTVKPQSLVPCMPVVDTFGYVSTPEKQGDKLGSQLPTSSTTPSHGNTGTSFSISFSSHVVSIGTLS